jgi:hypothetical protein
MLRLKLSEVKPYDRNPRIDENEQFSGIESCARRAGRVLPSLAPGETRACRRKAEIPA